MSSLVEMKLEFSRPSTSFCLRRKGLEPDIAGRVTVWIQAVGVSVEPFASRATSDFYRRDAQAGPRPRSQHIMGIQRGSMTAMDEESRRASNLLRCIT